MNIISTSVREPIANLGVSNTVRGAMAGWSKTLATELPACVSINNILPGPFDTERMHANIKVNAEKAGLSVEEMTERKAAANPAGRFGDPNEFGELCAFVCSAQAGYITGQNLLIDGGGFPGTF